MQKSSRNIADPAFKSAGFETIRAVLTTLTMLAMTSHLDLP